MKKNFDPSCIELAWYKFWEENGFFKPDMTNTDKKNFCIMMPPPNITGSLHMGHAFQQTIMDILIRYNRMEGKNTLWQFGTDHAGIATQVMLEKHLMKTEGKIRQEYNRESFIKKIWNWKNKYEGKIIGQIKRLGNSIDWDRKCFTLDSNMSYAVKEAFILLYHDNLIYKKHRIVNWDPKLQTVISDLEVEHRSVKSSMWYIKYPLLEDCYDIYDKKYLTIATTRPETLFGDVAVAINPHDIRYSKLVGKHVLIPLLNRKIPIILDKHANVLKGTGCVKITPAHDFDDYNVGLKHNLPMINIFSLDGKILVQPKLYHHTNHNIDNNKISIPKEFHHLDRFDARNKIINVLKKLELLAGIKPFDTVMSYGDRSGVILEPMLTNQWYLKTSQLSELAIQTVKEKNIVFFPKQYKNLYFSWMNNIQDWCISRQLWWGHRIPVWYDIDKNIYVGHNEEEIRKKYFILKNIKLKQEEDVLDTWFSSALWTFSTLGWPRKNKFLELFHSTDILVSGFDIIFFWIARMIMLTMYFIKDEKGKPQVPFKKIYITGLIRDETGQKMSKSKGNVIDPLDMINGISLEKLLIKRKKNLIKKNIEKLIDMRTKKMFPNGIHPSGTDAFRFTCTALASNTRDIHWDMNRLQGYQKFCNKLWNVSRFILLNITSYDMIQNNKDNELSFIDKWIISEFNISVKIYRKSLDTHRFDIAANVLYDFVWNKFCDWYIEFMKILINDMESNINYHTLHVRSTKITAVNILESVLRLAHPIIPFITEEIWQRIKILTKISEKTIMLQKFPKYNKNLVDKAILLDMQFLQKIIVAIRNLRSSIQSYNNFISVFLCNVNSKIINIIKENSVYLKRLSQVKSITMISDYEKPKFFISNIIDEVEVIIPLQDTINKEKELYLLNKQIEKIKLKILKLETQVSNKKFILFAPHDIVNSYKLSLKNFKKQKYELMKKISLISSL